MSTTIRISFVWLLFSAELGVMNLTIFVELLLVLITIKFYLLFLQSKEYDLV